MAAFPNLSVFLTYGPDSQCNPVNLPSMTWSPILPKLWLWASFFKLCLMGYGKMNVKTWSLGLQMLCTSCLHSLETQLPCKLQVRLRNHPEEVHLLAVPTKASEINLSHFSHPIPTNPPNEDYHTSKPQLKWAEKLPSFLWIIRNNKSSLLWACKFWSGLLTLGKLKK